MSTKNKLQNMTADLVIPDDDFKSAFPPAAVKPLETEFPVAGAPTMPKTGPGQMLAFMGQKAEADVEIMTLKERLSYFVDSMPAKHIDCADITPSSWANRHVDSFKTAAFLRLKDDIESAGGNVQPILVVSVQGTGAKYKIVFGHRRYNACKQLGLPVMAVVYDGVMNEKELFSTMDRENREREDLTAYEQGKMYRMALEEGLYPSARKLAEELGISHTWVNKSLTVSELPIAVVESFRSPLDIQARHGTLLKVALEKDFRGVLKRAEKLRGQRLTAGHVVEELIDLRADARPAKPVSMHVNGKKIGSIELGKKAILITLDPQQFESQKAEGLQKFIEEYLKN